MATRPLQNTNRVVKGRGETGGIGTGVGSQSQMAGMCQRLEKSGSSGNRDGGRFER